MNLDAIRGEDEILRVLRAAQERIRDPKNWCKKVMAQNISGNEVMPHEPTAIQYCARGALEAEVDLHNSLRASQLLHEAAFEMGYRNIDKSSVAELNDMTNHATVMLMFTRAQELRLADMLETVGAL